MSIKIKVRLTQSAEIERMLFYNFYGNSGCTCFLRPPCGFCTHPGNPANQDEDESCWEYDLKRNHNWRTQGF